MQIQEFYDEMKKCQACDMRKTCNQVVLADGCKEKPILMIVGESPGATEDEEGVPFVGDCGLLLRDVLRATKTLNKKNTIITNVLKCRPPGNKFPKGEHATVCVSKWLMKEIELLKPERLLLLGAVPLKYVGGMKGITSLRGQWYTMHGIRGLATFHPSYVMRQDSAGDIQTRSLFESDIFEIAKEIAQIQEKRNASSTSIA